MLIRKYNQEILTLIGILINIPGNAVAQKNLQLKNFLPKGFFFIKDVYFQNIAMPLETTIMQGNLSLIRLSVFLKK